MATITLPPGQINLKGPQEPNATDIWSPLPGGLTLAGLALTVVIATSTLAIPAGSYAFTGLAPAVRVGDKYIDIPAGEIVIKGPARSQDILSPAVGSVVFTGHVPVASVSTPGSAIAMSTGSLVYQGYAPLRVPNIFVDLPAGSLALSGQYIGVAFKQPDAGSVLYTGLAPVVNITGLSTIAIPAGSLAFTGLATLTPKSVGLPLGRLVFSSVAPEAAATSTIAIPAGSLVFTGHAVVSTPNITALLGAGVLRFSSDNAPVIHIDETRQPGAGAITFTGRVLVPVVGVADTVTAVPAGSLVYTGQVPTSAATTTTDIAIPAGSLVLTGYATLVNNGLTVNLPAGSLVLTGRTMVSQDLHPFLMEAGSLVFQGHLMQVKNSGVTSTGGDEFLYLWLYLYL